MSTQPLTEDTLDVGVVIVTYNSASVIGTLLETLDRGLSGVSWQAMVVDNDSDDETVDLVRTAGLDVVALDRNQGYSAGINCGVSALPRTRAVLVLNPDVELTSGSVAAMLAILDDDRVGVVAPKMLIPGDPPGLEPSQRREPSLATTWGTAVLGARAARHFPALFEAVTDERMYTIAQDVDWAVGAVLLSSRNCVEAVGDWDESYFLYSEETDYCHRARLAGFRVRYTPRALVLHRGGDGLVSPRLRSMMIVNKVREYRRRNGPVASWLFFVGTLLHESTRGIAGRRASRAAALALLRPRYRPTEMNANDSLMPN